MSSKKKVTPPEEIHELCTEELKNYIKDYALFLKTINDPHLIRKVSDKIFKIERELKVFSKYGQYVLDCHRK